MPNQLQAWGTIFPSMVVLSRDTRCVVPYSSLIRRLSHGWDIERAATAPPGSYNRQGFICWGGDFPTLSAIAQDTRCVVAYPALRDRLMRGWDIERAATAPSATTRVLVCWGEDFPTLSAIERDTRCVVAYHTLRDRFTRGWDIERAATTPPATRQPTSTNCTDSTDSAML
jgi:hypothetical protein